MRQLKTRINPSKKELPVPKTYVNAVKPKRIEVISPCPEHPRGKRIYFYDCEHCSNEIKTDKRKKHKHAFHDKKCQHEWQKHGKPPPKFSPEARRKMSEASRTSWSDSKNRARRLEAMRKAAQTPDTRRKHAEAMKKIASDPDWRRRISESMKKVANDPEWKEKQSKARKGKKRPSEVGRKISKAKMGHAVSEETREKLAEAARGEKSHFWRGGISGKKQQFYRSWQWRMQTERVKHRDDYACQGCGWTKNEVEKIGCHHITPLENWEDDWHDYPDELVTTLCEVCHGKSECQDGEMKWPINGRGDEARLERLRSKSQIMASLP